MVQSWKISLARKKNKVAPGDKSVSSKDIPVLFKDKGRLGWTLAEKTWEDEEGKIRRSSQGTRRIREGNPVGIFRRSPKSRDRRSCENGTYDLSRKYGSTRRHVSATVWGSRAHDGNRGALGRLARGRISRGAGINRGAEIGSVTADCRPPTVDCRLPTADR